MKLTPTAIHLPHTTLPITSHMSPDYIASALSALPLHLINRIRVYYNNLRVKLASKKHSHNGGRNSTSHRNSQDVSYGIIKSFCYQLSTAIDIIKFERGISYVQ